MTAPVDQLEIAFEPDGRVALQGFVGDVASPPITLSREVACALRDALARRLGAPAPNTGAPVA